MNMFRSKKIIVSIILATMLVTIGCPVFAATSTKSSLFSRLFNTLFSKETVSSVATIGSSILETLLGGSGFKKPVIGGKRSQGYSNNHKAIDIAIGEGTTICAAYRGTVETAEKNHWSYGNYIVINHGIYNGKEVKTLYAHCSKLNVSEKDDVAKGQNIAEVGSTGNSTGPHLHFEVRENGVRVDPTKYI